jgi:hypothetical protein
MYRPKRPSSDQRPRCITSSEAFNVTYLKAYDTAQSKDRGEAARTGRQVVHQLGLDRVINYNFAELQREECIAYKSHSSRKSAFINERQGTTSRYEGRALKQVEAAQPFYTEEQAHEAIQARRNGVWDDPQLMRLDRRVRHSTHQRC